MGAARFLRRKGECTVTLEQDAIAKQPAAVTWLEIQTIGASSSKLSTTTKQGSPETKIYQLLFWNSSEIAFEMVDEWNIMEKYSS